MPVGSCGSKAVCVTELVRAWVCEIARKRRRETAVGDWCACTCVCVHGPAVGVSQHRVRERVEGGAEGRVASVVELTVRPVLPSEIRPHLCIVPPQDRVRPNARGPRPCNSHCSARGLGSSNARESGTRATMGRVRDAGSVAGGGQLGQQPVVRHSASSPSPCGSVLRVPRKMHCTSVSCNSWANPCLKEPLGLRIWLKERR